MDNPVSADVLVQKKKAGGIIPRPFRCGVTRLFQVLEKKPGEPPRLFHGLSDHWPRDNASG